MVGAETFIRENSDMFELLNQRGYEVGRTHERYNTLNKNIQLSYMRKLKSRIHETTLFTPTRMIYV